VLISKPNSTIQKDEEFREIRLVHRHRADAGTAPSGDLQTAPRSTILDYFAPDRLDFRFILLSTCEISPKFLEILPSHPFEPNMAGGRIDRADIDRPWHGLGAVERSGKSGAAPHRGSNDPIQGDRQ
jgi:hypothetical protein